ncbi:hypothetical protein BUALT_Bualt12G0113500 [Buddleja alternifolia]|uniref:Uncharacterized protein n=1 Tax=Buddleja alternifolia TaxID=168488 RepID=A0AAV6WQZ3_9LAMI|nr:hypothetical protein BUALT_Bualt12G0113500 [Buddleja alternifolia]
MFPEDQFDFTDDVSKESIDSNNCPNEEVKKSPKHSNFYDSFFQAQFSGFNDLYVDVVSPPFQSCDDDEIRKILGIESYNSSPIEPEEKESRVLPMSSFEILRKHGSKRLRSKGAKTNSGCQVQPSINTISTEKIIELGAEKFIQSLSQSSNLYTSCILGHSKDVQLIQYLLLCAEKIGEKKYEWANKLLHECEIMSSCIGTPIERLVFYFTGALYEKIDREMGRITPKGLGKEKVLDPFEVMKCSNTSFLAFHETYPLMQVSKFSGMQAVLEEVVDARNVHMIDLEIRDGVKWTILMQALAGRHENPIQRLKITAVGMKSKASMEEAGRRLMAFSKSLNLNFCFDVIMVEDVLNLNKDLFNLDDDEAVAVYAAYTLTNMIGRPHQIEHLMEVIKIINPCVLIVTEVEANCNSPTFVGRFVEALFFYGAFFDSLADCMKNDEISRREIESKCLSSSIRNLVATEGGERKVRHVSINVWRAFFEHFGLMETDLSHSSVYQANLVCQSFPCGSSCTFRMNGKCLTFGWKGTPLFSVSAWKFQ